MLRMPYGFMISEDGTVTIHESEATVVKKVYQHYLSGDSLGKIVDRLKEDQIPSPSENDNWTRATVDKLLSNGKYMPCIISMDEFTHVQYEKANRSNIDYDNGKRKATRYSSEHELSGRLVCAECGANYRRITRPSGEVVWRCANRVEQGKEFCRNASAVSEADVKSAICRELCMDQYDVHIVKEKIQSIIVGSMATCMIKRKGALLPLENRRQRSIPTRSR
ncbi:MAG: recombinase family protein [Clostridiaceae bacterium]